MPLYDYEDEVNEAARERTGKAVNGVVNQMRESGSWLVRYLIAALKVFLGIAVLILIVNVISWL